MRASECPTDKEELEFGVGQGPRFQRRVVYTIKDKGWLAG